MSPQSFSIHTLARNELALRRDQRQSSRPEPAIRHRTRGFWALIVTQFQGAFSDNVLKNLVIFVALFGTSMTLVEKNSYGESIGALFALPFILFSMAGGFLADRFSKRSVMLGVKVFELFIMSLVFAGLWPWNKNLLLASVFLMGTHSAIFGPSKYGSLPELLPERKLSWGNGVLELGTFMAIILGTVAAALMSQAISRTTMAFRRRPHRAGGVRIFRVPRHHQSSGGGSAKEIQRQFPRRNLAATPRHARRPSALAGAHAATPISTFSACCCC